LNKTAFNDGWVFANAPVTLPHDAMINDRRVPDCTSGSGCAYFPGGVYEYEKRFAAPQDWSGKTAILEFEGVYRNAKVYVNGCAAGGKPYGYIPFYVDLTPYLRIGEEIVVRVVADNSQTPNSRWYSGGGIFRPVWLWLGGADALAPDSVRITTLSYMPAHIRVETGRDDASVTITDSDAIVATGLGAIVELEICSAKLWSAETPHLYQCTVSTPTDSVTHAFGIRKIEWSAKGLFINGVETKLRGGCVHHDNGILGACSYPEAEERRVRILRGLGFNAIRSAHNPISKSALEACDRLGMYVMDETWDMWYTQKTAHDYSYDFPANWQDDTRALINRDYNHPSVIMYSIGNEVNEPHDAKGIAQEKAILDFVHSLDVTRPVTCAINLMILFACHQGIWADNADTAFTMPTPKNSTEFNEIASEFFKRSFNSNPEGIDDVVSPALSILDIAGYNYASSRYQMDGESHPERIIVGSETFPWDIGENWAMVKRCPYLIGDFMWTAWDYLGEAGLGAWAYTDDGATFTKPYPWLLADAGAVDILGNPGAEAEYAAIVWGVRRTPYIGVQPVNHPGVVPAKYIWRGTNAIASWAWRGCEGNPAVVEVYADAAEAELSLDGVSLGRKSLINCRASFNTQYQPGNLTAVVYDETGKEVSRSTLFTPSGEARLHIAPEKCVAAPGELVYVPIIIAYANSAVESNMDDTVVVTVDGGELLAFGSANPRTEERFIDGRYTTYYGRSLAVVRCGDQGVVRISAYSKRYPLQSAEIRVNSGNIPESNRT
jgi:hypothetical protein